MLGLIPGAVTPLGLLNDRGHKVTFFLDKSFLEGSGLSGSTPTITPPPCGSRLELLKLLRKTAPGSLCLMPEKAGWICRLPGDPSESKIPHILCL